MRWYSEATVTLLVDSVRECQALLEQRQKNNPTAEHGLALQRATLCLEAYMRARKDQVPPQEHTRGAKVYPLACGWRIVVQPGYATRFEHNGTTYLAGVVASSKAAFVKFPAMFASAMVNGDCGDNPDEVHSDNQEGEPKVYDFYQNDTGQWFYRVVDELGIEIGRSLQGYPTRAAAKEAAHSTDRLHMRCDLRTNEASKFGWMVKDGEKVVAENSMWFETAADAIFNASQNGYAISVGEGVTIDETKMEKPKYDA